MWLLWLGRTTWGDALRATLAASACQCDECGLRKFVSCDHDLAADPPPDRDAACDLLSGAEGVPLDAAQASQARRAAPSPYVGLAVVPVYGGARRTWGLDEGPDLLRGLGLRHRLYHQTVAGLLADAVLRGETTSTVGNLFDCDGPAAGISIQSLATHSSNGVTRGFRSFAAVHRSTRTAVAILADTGSADLDVAGFGVLSTLGTTASPDGV